jgi:hypothetical protein
LEEKKLSALYHHTQFAPWIISIMLILTLGCVAGAYASRLAAIRWSIGPLALVFAAVGLIFSALTVGVSETEVTWYFGPGLWTYSLPRSEIRNVAVVRNSWANGLGIRWAPGFRLYNVQGLDAVQLRLRDGTITRIGTDEAPALAAALK